MSSENQIKNSKEILSSLYPSFNPYEILPEIQGYAPEVETLQKLVQYEQKIDELINNKQMNLQEQLLKPYPKLKKILRVCISSSYQNLQNSMDMEEQPSWTLKIRGKILSSDQDPNSSSQLRKFSYYLRQIIISFDDPQIEPIVWKKQNQNTGETDGFEIKKFGNQQINAKIQLYLYNNPQKFKLHEKLAKLLGIKACSRTTALQLLWEYIKIGKLQDQGDKNVIKNDEPLKEIFGYEKMQLDMITMKLQSLLFPLDPIEITHQVQLIQQEEENYYDIQVEQDNIFHFDVSALMIEKIQDEKYDTIMQNIAKNQQDVSNQNQFYQIQQKIKKLEKKNIGIIDQIKRHQLKRKHYLKYKENPSTYIDNMIAEQNHLLKVVQGNFSLKDLYQKPQFSQYIIHNEESIEKEIRDYLVKNQQKEFHEQEQS